MSRFKRLGVNIVHIVRMKDARTGTTEYCLFTWGISETEAAPARFIVSTMKQLKGMIERWREENEPRLFSGSADNSYAFWHHDLVPDVSV